MADPNEIKGNLELLRSQSIQQQKRDIEATRRKLDAIGDVDRIFYEAATGRNSYTGALSPDASKAKILRERLDDAVEYAATRVAQAAYSDPTSPAGRLMEMERASASSQMRTHGTGQWNIHPVKKFVGTKEILRYEVKGKKGALADQFRHKAVAEMVAAALDQTSGNLGDPRIDRIRELCREEDRLISEINNQKRLVESVDPANVKRHGAHKTKLDEARIALQSVRRRLGVA